MKIINRILNIKLPSRQSACAGEGWWKRIVVCNEKEKRVHGKIEIIPWREFLQDLWSGKVLN